MSQAIELIAGSTPLTLLITSASQVPHKLVILDEIPETVQACLTKWLFQRKLWNQCVKKAEQNRWHQITSAHTERKKPNHHINILDMSWEFGILVLSGIHF